MIGHTKGGSKEVFYFGADGHVHQIWGYSGCPGGPAFDGWHGVDITGAAAGAPSAAAGSPLVGFYNPASLDYVFYVDTNQNVQELSQGEAWRNQVVASNAAGAVAAHQNGTLDEVAFIDSNENLQLYTSPSTTPNAWSSQGALGGVVTAQGSPLATDVLGGLDEYYHIGFGNTVYSVYRLQFSGGSWTVTNMNTTYDGAIQSPSPIP